MENRSECFARSHIVYGESGSIMGPLSLSLANVSNLPDKPTTTYQQTCSRPK